MVRKIRAKLVLQLRAEGHHAVREAEVADRLKIELDDAALKS